MNKNHVYFKLSLTHFSTDLQKIQFRHSDLNTTATYSTLQNLLIKKMTKPKAIKYFGIKFLCHPTYLLYYTRFSGKMEKKKSEPEKLQILTSMISFIYILSAKFPFLQNLRHIALKEIIAQFLSKSPKKFKFSERVQIFWSIELNCFARFQHFNFNLR